MALRPIILLRTIVDQILMERCREKQSIIQANWDCDYYVSPYRRRERYCREPTKAFQTRRPLCTYYDRGLSNAERYATFMRLTYDENEAIVGGSYAISDDSFNPSMPSSSSVERYKEQDETDDYGNNMPSKPTHYMSGEDTSSNSGNGFKNLARD